MPSTPTVRSETRRTVVRPVQVLVVDDHPIVREVLSEIIEDLGATALTATGYATALAVARRQPVDLVLTDVMLGQGPDGFALAETLRGEQPDIDIVIVSAATAPTGATRRSTETFDYWLKPLDVERLAERITAQR